MNAPSLTRALVCLLAMSPFAAPPAVAVPPHPSTFSIAAADPEAGEVGVAVASRFFAVGSVVPWVRADAGAVATQAYANTAYGEHGLALLGLGATPQEALAALQRGDAGKDRRQVGIVATGGGSVTFSGPGCSAWAGGRAGPGYAVQGNILVGEAVVVAMEKAFVESKGKPLADRLLQALKAGDAAGGDSRGRQSAALIVARAGGGYGGVGDRAIDVRVDDHADPFGELGRLVGIATVMDTWNRGWTLFTEGKFEQARRWQEQAVVKAEGQPSILPEAVYDLAVIRLAAGDRGGALEAARRAIELNPKLAAQAAVDDDLEPLREELRTGTKK